MEIIDCYLFFIKDHLCPVFQLNYIMDKAEPDPAEKYKMLIKVGLISFFTVIQIFPKKSFTICSLNTNLLKFKLKRYKYIKNKINKFYINNHIN